MTHPVPRATQTLRGTIVTDRTYVPKGTGMPAYYMSVFCIDGQESLLPVMIPQAINQRLTDALERTHHTDHHARVEIRATQPFLESGIPALRARSIRLV